MNAFINSMYCGEAIGLNALFGTPIGGGTKVLDEAAPLKGGGGGIGPVYIGKMPGGPIGICDTCGGEPPHGSGNCGGVMACATGD